jgi:fermentation-respiration switch protein FrsA (DUF1100 family)
MSILKWLLIIVAVGYVGGLAAMFFLQRAILFPIPSTERIAPSAAGFPQVEEHFLTTSDGEKIVVWHMPAKPGRPVILYFHGNGDYLAGFFARFRDFIAEGIGVVAPAYRGYSGSGGKPSEHGLLQDAEAAWVFTTSRYDASRIVAWGFSLGSGVAVALAAEHRVSKLVLEASYSSIADVAASAFPILPVRLLLQDPFRSDLRIARVKAKLLFMHGARDGTIPIVFGERLFALANEPKQFVRFPDGGHNDLDYFGASAVARRFIGAPDG